MIPSRPLAEGFRFAGHWKKVGSAFASRFFFFLPVPTRPRLPSLRMSAPSAVVAVGSVRPFPAGHSVTAKLETDSVFRVAPSGIFRIPPVDNGDIVDKCNTPDTGVHSRL